ncbi:MAG: adenosylcobinamide-GDP ribazoletransferase [Bryobacterales bacterium]|nr:adenosylcobinamide-GDP ribazoletransferase [Bryobacterales bacterium]
MRRLLGAIQFLTVLPIRGRTAPPGRSALFFPLVGAGLGWLAGQWLRMLEPSLGSSLTAVLVLAFLALVTGGLHEDGLADVADALRAHRSREKMTAILKDSRIGVFGALALVYVVAMRWQALTRLPADGVRDLVACLAVSRAALVAQAWVSRPVGDGLGAAFSRDLDSITAVFAIASGVAFAFLPGVAAGAAILVAAGLSTSVLNRWFDARLGGVNGDCLGATCLVSETFALLFVSCRNCFW